MVRLADICTEEDQDPVASVRPQSSRTETLPDVRDSVNIGVADFSLQSMLAQEYRSFDFARAEAIASIQDEMRQRSIAESSPHYGLTTRVDTLILTFNKFSIIHI